MALRPSSRQAKTPDVTCMVLGPIGQKAKVRVPIDIPFKDLRKKVSQATRTPIKELEVLLDGEILRDANSEPLAKIEDPKAEPGTTLHWVRVDRVKSLCQHCGLENLNDREELERKDGPLGAAASPAAAKEIAAATPGQASQAAAPKSATWPPRGSPGGPDSPQRVPGRSVLHYAVLNGDADLCKYILDDKMCNPSLIDYQDTFGDTALILACLLGYLDCVEALCDRGVNKELVNMAGRTAIMFAAEHGHMEVLLILLAVGASIDPVPGTKIPHALHLAKLNDRTECAFVLQGHKKKQMEKAKREADGKANSRQSSHG